MPPSTYPVDSKLINAIIEHPHENTFDAGCNADAAGAALIPLHPRGVKPLGNRYLHHGSNARDSLGSWALLPDEMLIVVLEYCEEGELRQAARTCRFFYALCQLDELWKNLFLRLPKDVSETLVWRRSWRRTVLNLSKDQEVAIDCGNVFSDVLHRPFACMHINLAPFIKNIPKTNLIRRFDHLTYEQYAERWTGQPFILTSSIRQWPIFSQWTIDGLRSRYGQVKFRAEAVDWSFDQYCRYMFENEDESPLYLFDRDFAIKMGINVDTDVDAAYWKPECFGPDLFDVLGSERPAHRWLIVGPSRSGSTFHKDPNGTSAWNAVIRGAKYWIMFPPDAQVPGVYVSRDRSEVTSPLSIAGWLLSFHEEARRMPGCLEGICREGELLHVPSGWWHLVVNVESGIAVTQNFVPQSPNPRLLSEVLIFLKEKVDQVSGFPQDVADPYQLFVDRLRQRHPSVLAKAQELVAKKKGRKRCWGAGAEEGEDAQGRDAGGFAFGFGSADELVIA